MWGTKKTQYLPKIRPGAHTVHKNTSLFSSNVLTWEVWMQDISFAPPITTGTGHGVISGKEAGTIVQYNFTDICRIYLTNSFVPRARDITSSPSAQISKRQTYGMRFIISVSQQAWPQELLGHRRRVHFSPPPPSVSLSLVFTARCWKPRSLVITFAHGGTTIAQGGTTIAQGGTTITHGGTGCGVAPVACGAPLLMVVHHYSWWYTP